MEIKIETFTEAIPFVLTSLLSEGIDQYPAHHLEVLLENDRNIKFVFVGYLSKELKS